MIILNLSTRSNISVMKNFSRGGTFFGALSKYRLVGLGRKINRARVYHGLFGRYGLRAQSAADAKTCGAREGQRVGANGNFFQSTALRPDLSVRGDWTLLERHDFRFAPGSRKAFFLRSVHDDYIFNHASL